MGDSAIDWEEVFATIGVASGSANQARPLPALTGQTGQTRQPNAPQRSFPSNQYVQTQTQPSPPSPFQPLPNAHAPLGRSLSDQEFFAQFSQSLSATALTQLPAPNEAGPSQPHPAYPPSPTTSTDAARDLAARARAGRDRHESHPYSVPFQPST